MCHQNKYPWQFLAAEKSLCPSEYETKTGNLMYFTDVFPEIPLRILIVFQWLFSVFVTCQLFTYVLLVKWSSNFLLLAKFVVRNLFSAFPRPILILWTASSWAALLRSPPFFVVYFVGKRLTPSNIWGGWSAPGISPASTCEWGLGLGF